MEVGNLRERYYIGYFFCLVNVRIDMCWVRRKMLYKGERRWNSKNLRVRVYMVKFWIEIGRSCSFGLNGTGKNLVYFECWGYLKYRFFWR